MTCLVVGCANAQIKNGAEKKVDTLSTHSPTSVFENLLGAPPQTDTMVDPRDGATYRIVTIGKQKWMAENLRYKLAGSWLNPENPSTLYGRLYDIHAAQRVCPPGWHLPSDAEWNEMELALGMPMADTSKTGWRGLHGTALKSVDGWLEDGNGTNSSGFNAYPAGYYDSGSFDGGLAASSGFWSSINNSGKGAWVRFVAAPMVGVNRFFDDINNNHIWAIACRCVED